MKSYGQFCPIAMALDVLGERWTLLVMREVLTGSSRFNEIIRGVPLISRTMLSQRLKTLEEAGIVERRDDQAGPRYYPSQAGQELLPVLVGMGNWGQRWARGKLDKELIDPRLLMWDMQRNVNQDALPDKRVVVHFWFRDVPSKVSRDWLCLERDGVDLCLQNPGYEIDLQVQTKARTMVEVWLGDRDLSKAMRSGDVEVSGPRALRQGFPGWLKLSMFASAPRVA